MKIGKNEIIGLIVTGFGGLLTFIGKYFDERDLEDKIRDEVDKQLKEHGVSIDENGGDISK